MNKDLERVIALQQLDSAAQEAQRHIAESPEREKALDARLDAARKLVDGARARLAENQSSRRLAEKEVAVQQGRLSKFRDQLMAVKTNREYQAMQHEIEIAQSEVKTFEEKLLERMIEADDLSAEVTRAESDLSKEQKAVDADRRTMVAEIAELQASLDRIASDRTKLVASLNQQVLATFEQVARKRNGIAVAEARDGVCTICHVRLRPQVFNMIRSNDALIQCDSCNRILYFSGPAPAAAPDSVTRSAP